METSSGCLVQLWKLLKFCFPLIKYLHSWVKKKKLKRTNYNKKSVRNNLLFILELIEFLKNHVETLISHSSQNWLCLCSYIFVKQVEENTSFFKLEINVNNNYKHNFLTCLFLFCDRCELQIPLPDFHSIIYCQTKRNHVSHRLSSHFLF